MNAITLTLSLLCAFMAGGFYERRDWPWMALMLASTGGWLVTAA